MASGFVIHDARGMGRALAQRMAARGDRLCVLGRPGESLDRSAHDLEIRGAGEILGEGQSGQIQEVGYSMYTRLLERAVHALRRMRRDLPREPA